MFVHLCFLGNKVHFYSLRIHYIRTVYRKALVFDDQALVPNEAHSYQDQKASGDDDVLLSLLGQAHIAFQIHEYTFHFHGHHDDLFEVHDRTLETHGAQVTCIDRVARHDDQMEMEISVLPVHSAGKVTYVGHDVYGEGDRSS